MSLPIYLNAIFTINRENLSLDSRKKKKKVSSSSSSYNIYRTKLATHRLSQDEKITKQELISPKTRSRN